jgi:SAM-dependent methyltransferase
MSPGAAHRRSNMLLTMVMVCIGLTPAWFLPTWLARPWLLLALLLLAPLLWITWRYAPWVPTPHDELERLVALLELTPDECFCDLGAGDGRVLVAVHRASGARCVGVELAPLMWGLARLRTLPWGSQIRLVLGDVHRADLSGVDAFFVWGTAQWLQSERFAQLCASLPPGARIVSYHHRLPGLEAERVDPDGQRPMYRYRCAG